MKIILTSATEAEISLLKSLVKENQLLFPFFKNIHFHTSGVGILQSCFSIQQMILKEQPDLLLQVGIAGSFTKELALGAVVGVEQEYLGSCGVDEQQQWKDIFDLQLSDKNQFPFAEKSLKNPWVDQLCPPSLKRVNAITIDEISTSPDRMNKLITKYHCLLESMEGACLHYCALNYKVRFLQLRGISNYVGDRDKQNWKIKSAIEAVCNQTFNLLKGFSQSENDLFV